MLFSEPLIPGRLVRRYKRFMADIELEDGEIVTAHCFNPGAMLGLIDPGCRVWISKAKDPLRKLQYTWHLVEADSTLVGTNTSWPNKLAEEAILEGTIKELQGYQMVQREVKYGVNSRIDLLLTSPDRPPCYVEVKNVHYRRHTQALFPDSVTARGAKHLEELAALTLQGIRAVMLYIIQRSDCHHFGLAGDIDPAYMKAMEKARVCGVEALAYACVLSETEIKVVKSLPIGER